MFAADLHRLKQIYNIPFKVSSYPCKSVAITLKICFKGPRLKLRLYVKRGLNAA